MVNRNPMVNVLTEGMGKVLDIYTLFFMTVLGSEEELIMRLFK
jgi:hypothetical protein